MPCVISAPAANCFVTAHYSEKHVAAGNGRAVRGGKENGWHSEGYAALESYLENTPGFLLANAEYPETWEARAFEQHNYMSRQFLKTLSCSMKLMAMFFRKTAAISGWTIFSTMTAFSSS